MSMDDMTTRQKELLLAACMHRISLDQRGYLMREVPDAYNAYCGRPVVKVVRVSDGEEM